MADLDIQLKNYRLTTANIFYHLPDFDKLLQEYVWQDYDIPPCFPRLEKFLHFWEKEIDGRIHSVRVGHKDIITPGDTDFVDFEGLLN